MKETNYITSDDDSDGCHLFEHCVPSPVPFFTRIHSFLLCTLLWTGDFDYPSFTDGKTKEKLNIMSVVTSTAAQKEILRHEQQTIQIRAT